MGCDLVRVLILDDELERHAEFDAIYAGHEVTHTASYTQFIKELIGGSPWDLIHLDHDLGHGDSYLDGWGNSQFYTGQHAAERICELKDEELPSEVIVHSMNPLGSQNILFNLRARRIPSSWRPYSTLKRK